MPDGSITGKEIPSSSLLWSAKKALSGLVSGRLSMTLRSLATPAATAAAQMVAMIEPSNFCNTFKGAHSDDIFALSNESKCFCCPTLEASIA